MDYIHIPSHLPVIGLLSDSLPDAGGLASLSPSYLTLATDSVASLLADAALLDDDWALLRLLLLAEVDSADLLDPADSDFRSEAAESSLLLTEIGSDLLDPAESDLRPEAAESSLLLAELLAEDGNGASTSE